MFENKKKEHFKARSSPREYFIVSDHTFHVKRKDTEGTVFKMFEIIKKPNIL